MSTGVPVFLVATWISKEKERINPRVLLLIYKLRFLTLVTCQRENWYVFALLQGAIHSLPHSLTYSPSLNHSITLSINQPLTQPLTQSLTQSLTHSFINFVFHRSSFFILVSCCPGCKQSTAFVHCFTTTHVSGVC